MKIKIILLCLIFLKPIISQNELQLIENKIDSLKYEIKTLEHKVEKLEIELQSLEKERIILKNSGRVNANEEEKYDAKSNPQLHLTNPEVIKLNEEIDSLAKAKLQEEIDKQNIKLREEINKEDVASNEEIDKAKKNGIPVFFRDARVTFNVIDNPEAFIELQNTCEKTIDAYTIDIHCYDRFGKEAKDGAYGDNIFKGISQNTIKPGRVESGYWTLYGHENAALIKVYIDKVHFTDGTTWKPSKGKNPMIEGRSDK